MACLGVEPGAAGWKAQTNPLSNGGTLILWNSYHRYNQYALQTIQRHEHEKNQQKAPSQLLSTLLKTVSLHRGGSLWLEFLT